MWLLHLLPDSFLEFIVNTILILGAVSCFLSFFVINRLLRYFPPLARYYHIAQVVSLIVFLAGVYFKGGYSTEMIWRERVREVEAKLAESEKHSQQINDDLKKERLKKSKVVKEYAVTIQDRIVEKEKIINAECKVNPDAVQIINDAAKGAPKK